MPERTLGPKGSELQYLLVVGLSCYSGIRVSHQVVCNAGSQGEWITISISGRLELLQWYQSLSPSSVPARTLGPYGSGLQYQLSGELELLQWYQSL